MGCDCHDPYLFVSNDAVADVPTGGLFPLGNVVHQQCGACTLEGDAVVCRGEGSFEVSGVATVSQKDTSGSTPPLLSATVVVDGRNARGGLVAGSSSGTIALPVQTVVRNCPGCGSSTVSLKNLGPAVSLTSLSLVVRPV